MSTTLDAEVQKTIALKSLKSACNIYLADLNALPEDVFTKCFGGKARSVADFTYEVTLVMDHVGLKLRGEEQFPWPEEQWLKAPENVRTKAEVIEAFQTSSDRIVATIEATTAEKMAEFFEDDGRETNRYERCRFMTLHLWYHSGQLNFIQTLLGDDGWHWQ